jgi:hypothetical protein
MVGAQGMYWLNNKTLKARIFPFFPTVLRIPESARWFLWWFVKKSLSQGCRADGLAMGSRPRLDRREAAAWSSWRSRSVGGRRASQGMGRLFLFVLALTPD